MRPMRNPSSCPRAFTLTELLVVLVILAALTAIVFPVLARARESARRATCKSNLHQIGLALALYRADYDGVDAQKSVPLSHSELGLPYHFSYDVFYNQYVKNREVLFCPSYTGGDRKYLGSTYAWAMTESELLNPSQDYEAIAALRGPDYPIAECLSHNGDIPRTARRSNELMYYHVLRIDGRVTVKIVPPTTPLNLETW